MFAPPLQSYHHQQAFFRPYTTSSPPPILHNARLFSMSSSSSESPKRLAGPSFKHAPSRPGTISRSPSKRRDLRNAVLLKGVKDRRQNARDELRSEYILRSDILAEQRTWEAAQRAEAAKWALREEDAMDDVVEDIPDDVAELEEMLAHEQAEIEARIAEQAAHKEPEQSGGFGSEDDMDILLLQAAEEWDRDMDLS